MQHTDSIVIHPNIATLKEGVPDLNGFEIHVITLGDDTTPTKTITLQFSRCNGDRSVLEDMNVYLLNGDYGPAEFESQDSLPHLMGYRIGSAEHRHAKRPMSLLVLECDKGSLSFTFEKAFHTTSVYKTK